MAESASSDVRRAVAAVVQRDDGLVLAVRRPDEPGEELPGLWGLPAVTLHEDESVEDGVRRIGREKLAVELTPLRALAEGEQQRDSYALHMTVYQASMAGEPSALGGPSRTPAATGTQYDAVDWLPAESFREASNAGSLCCRLLVETTPPSAP